MTKLANSPSLSRSKIASRGGSHAADPRAWEPALLQNLDSPGRFSVGVDIIEIERIEGVLRRHGERFLQRVYTPAEQVYCRGRVPELAARFAAKEAVSKALGTGLRGIAWREMEILGDERGKPLVHLHGRAKARAEELGLSEFAISLSHSRDYAVAFVMAAGRATD